MRIFFVTPAWGRPSVTRLALAQRSILRDELATRGVTLECVVVCDDENLEVARSFGFDTIEMGNDYLGEKVNAGFAWAGEREADYIAFIGSDDWMHIDLFDALDGERIVSGHEITVVDLLGARSRHLGWRHRYGVPPWFIPRSALEHCGFRPCKETAQRGMEFQLAWALQHVGVENWVMHDPHPLARVDFKSNIGMTDYDTISSAIGVGEEDAQPFLALGEQYGAELAWLAIETGAGLLREKIAA